MSHNTSSTHADLSRICRTALGSLHCELARREKLVLDQILKQSFDLGLDAAMFGSSDQIALLARMHKTDVSGALSSLKRNRLIQVDRANPLLHFRRPMLYRVLPDALLRVAAEPALRVGSRVIDKLRADTAAWLVHANRCYPLQPDLIAPDPRLLDLALAEISRASALDQDHLQNGEPKPAHHGAGEAYPPEHVDRPALTLVSIPDQPGEQWLDSDELARRCRESLGQPPAEPGLVRKIQTTSPPSLNFSNYSRAGDQISDDKDGDNLSPSEIPDGDARGPVRKIQTTADAKFVLEAAMLLTRFGEQWKPPTAAQETFDELARCMGAAMGNYSGWWWPKCRDAATRRDVIEAIATWKLARHSPKHKPWRGGAWRDEFHRRQRARLGLAEKAPVGLS